MALQKILIIDDDPDILNIIEYNLQQEGFFTKTANNGLIGIELANSFRPDLIILDVMMPEMDGIEVCQELRNSKNTENTLITFLTARGEDYSQIAGFEAGADDYIAKPIKPKVLVSRIKALLRRSESILSASEQVLQDKDVVIDRDKFEVVKSGNRLQLPKKEFELLSLLLSKPGNVFTRDNIMSEVWGLDSFVGDRTIDVHIRKLRKKIGEEYIKTVKGVGYKFESR